MTYEVLPPYFDTLIDNYYLANECSEPGTTVGEDMATKRHFEFGTKERRRNKNKKKLVLHSKVDMVFK